MIYCEDVERFHFGERVGGEAPEAAGGVGEGQEAGGPGKGARGTPRGPEVTPSNLWLNNLGNF